MLDQSTLASPSPFLKWAGGKTQLLDVFTKFYPRRFNRYYEPFLGGGAVFFHLCTLGKVQRAAISDVNKALVNCYVTIRDNFEGLVERLSELQTRAHDKKFYYEAARPRFNTLRLATGLEGDVEKASLLIYLNRTCYNGLYRVNSKGEFNVPWGYYKNAQVCDEETLKAVRAWLKRTEIEIRCEDYKTALDSPRDGDFVYIDPPYQPLSLTSSFTDYTNQGFDLSDQKILGKCVSELDARGCFVMISNSHVPQIKEIYRSVAEKGRLETVYASRAISSVGTGRGKIPEYLITNYKVN